MCLGKVQIFWKSQGKIGEFHEEKYVGTLNEIITVSTMSVSLFCAHSGAGMQELPTMTCF